MSPPPPPPPPPPTQNPNQPHHLIDVRTAPEFSTCHLTRRAAHTAPTLNVPHDRIAQLDVPKHDRISLYCRSGRRSALALVTLVGLGYGHVRDLGGWEQAREVLEGEGGVLAGAEGGRECVLGKGEGSEGGS